MFCVCENSFIIKNNSLGKNSSLYRNQSTRIKEISMKKAQNKLYLHDMRHLSVPHARLSQIHDLFQRFIQIRDQGTDIPNLP